MDIKGMLESEWLGTQYVKESPSKIAVILNPGMETLSKEGRKKLELLVEIDGKRKKYTLNVTSMKNLSAKFGTETYSWIGKKIGLVILSINGKDSIVANPLD